MRDSYQKAVVYISITLVLLWSIYAHSREPSYFFVLAGKSGFQVEVADTLESRRQGLMHRAELPVSHGLLMVMPQSTRIAVWMKNMRFPIDAVWLSSQGEVLHHQQLPVCESLDCPVYSPSLTAKYLLEVGLGEFPLKVGDRVEIIAASRDSLPSQTGTE